MHPLMMDEGHPESALGDQEAMMDSHPSTVCNLRDLHPADLLVAATRERLAVTAVRQRPGVTIVLPSWRVVTHAVRVMLSGLSLRPRLGAWTHA